VCTNCLLTCLRTKCFVGQSFHEITFVRYGMSMTTAGWTFLSNHGHVLVMLTREPGVRMRDVAERVGITERAVQQIVRDLRDAGYIEIERVGRRNRYRVAKQLPLRHPVEHDTAIGELLEVLNPS
jgi:DNA-binding transcriptional ArsR family regulator